MFQNLLNVIKLVKNYYPEMKILYVTNMYPSYNSNYGIFIKEQIEKIIKRLSCEYDLYYINAREKGTIQYLISIFAIPLKILKRDYNVIHIHYGISGLFLLLYKPKVKVFITLHGSDILKKGGLKYQVYLTKKILRKVDKVFILNKEMEEIVKQLRVNYEILPCGVDVDFFKPTKHMNDEKDTKLIIFPGNPSVAVKNYPLFEKIIVYLRLKCPFKITCQSIYKLTRNEVRELLNKGDCLLMTSKSEGSPQVIKEALACGLPVVSVPVGDVIFMLDQIPFCHVSTSYDVEDLSSLVLKSFEGKGEIIRNAFVNKKIYDQNSITYRIIKNYKAGIRNS